MKKEKVEKSEDIELKKEVDKISENKKTPKKKKQVSKVKNKEQKKETKKLKKENKKLKKQEKSEKKSKKKTKKKKRKINKLNVILVLLSFIFLIIGILVTLIGTGVINFNKDTGPILYPLNEKVKVGDYVDYDAGVWEEDKDVPNRTTAFTLGGYKKDISRNDGVTCNYNNKKNKGWRVFSIDDDAVTLIQSGISMCYYHGYGNATNDRSVNILNGNDENTNFDYFLDEKFSKEVRILSKEDIDKFINEDASYKRINNELISVGNPYWLATKSGSYYMWYVTEGGTIAVDHVGSYGVRILITLKKNTKTIGQDKEKVWQLTEEVKKDE